jgi:putative aminopeptidase FrvX
MKKKLELLKELTDANGAPGNETQVRKVMEKHLENVADVITNDKLGSFIGIKYENVNKGDFQEKAPRVMVAGHMDEVALLLKKIDERGFIKFQPLGGWWGHVVLGQEFNIITEDNKIITGVVGSTPPHILEPGARDKVMKLENMFIDIGVKDKDEAENLGLQIGDIIIPKVEFERMGNKDYLKAKAFDNRVGCGVAIEVMKNLDKECPVELYSVGTVQEEVGLRGATTSANKVKPDVAFVVDVTLAGDMPGVSGIDAKLGGGPLVILMDAMTLGHRGLSKLAMKVAKDLEMNVEFDIMPKGGTDAGRIHISGEGVPTLGFAVASRYIHSHCSMIHYQDYKDLIKLITEMCKRIDWELINKLND